MENINNRVIFATFRNKIAEDFRSQVKKMNR